MAAIKMWQIAPGSDFGSKMGWRSLGDNRYEALRARLLIVQTNGNDSRFGPIVHAVNVAPNDTVVRRSKRTIVVSRATTMTEAIRFATTSRVCERLASRISSEFGGQFSGFGGKVSAELLSNTEYEITSTVVRTLGATESYTVQETEEEEVVTTLTGGAVARVAEFRRRYWPRRWDVYLHSFDYLELTYRTSWFWRDVRKTMKPKSDPLGWPLVSLTFYEPQPGLDICYGVTDALENEDSIGFEPNTTPMPRSIPPDLDGLEDLAKIAFPVTTEERTRAALRPKKAAPKKAHGRTMKSTAAKKKAAPKKAAAAKKMAKRSSAKKAVPRSARKRMVPRHSFRF